jgi:prepilin-type N-terminal cleavage/methylation domain-containing protein
MNRAAKQQGFTLIELMLAMAFISVLLLAIALTIIQIGVIYNRGMTLKEVNQTSRSINDELRRSMAASSGFDAADKLVMTPAGGRLCLGEYSYIWNTAKALQNKSSDLTIYQGQTLSQALQNPNELIRFIKVPDLAGIYCAKASNGVALLYSSVRSSDKLKAVELLRAGDRMLSLYSFAISTGTNTNDTTLGEQLFTIDYTIGTGNVTAMNSDQTACLPPSNPNSDFAYCTVQQFKLVTRAGSGVN